MDTPDGGERQVLATGETPIEGKNGKIIVPTFLSDASDVLSKFVKSEIEC
jgi:hypothetical protein